MLGGYASTVIESFIAHDLFNHLEHLLYAVAGVCFAVLSVTVLTTRSDAGGEDA